MEYMKALQSYIKLILEIKIIVNRENLVFLTMFVPLKNAISI